MNTSGTWLIEVTGGRQTQLKMVFKHILDVKREQTLV